MSTTSSDQQYNNIINTISKLQELEQKLYTDLENSSTSNNLAEQQNIRDKINSLSQTRIDLFNSLKEMHSMSQNSVINNRSTLLNSLISLNVMENELNNLKGSLDELNASKENKLKMVQINTYYGKRYKAHSDLMKSIFIICAVILFVVILDKKGFLPNNVGPLAVIILLVLGIIYVFNKIMDLNKRDNLDFDKYKWRKPAPRTYDYNKVFKEEETDTSFDTSVCKLAEAASKVSKNIVDSALNEANRQAAQTGSSNTSPEGFDILGFNILEKKSSPAAY
jgi:hypothetical protein